MKITRRHRKAETVSGQESFAALRSETIKTLDRLLADARSSKNLVQQKGAVVRIQLAWTTCLTPSIIVPTGEELDILLSRPIEELGRIRGALNKLYFNGYQIIGDVVRLNEATLMKEAEVASTRNLRDLRRKITALGLDLEMKVPVGPREREAALSGPVWTYMCPTHVNSSTIHSKLSGTPTYIHTLGDLLQAKDEVVIDVLQEHLRDPQAELEAMRTRVRERGLID